MVLMSCVFILKHMRTRHDIEELEVKILAPYAMRSKDSGGRDHKEGKNRKALSAPVSSVTVIVSSIVKLSESWNIKRKFLRFTLEITTGHV